MPSLPPHEKTAEWMTIRIHNNPKNPEWHTMCERQFDSYISCYETHSNRPHVHILVKIKVSRSVQIKKLLTSPLYKLKGNTDFSVSNVFPTKEDLHEVSKYTCKGDNKKTLPCVVFKSPDWTDAKIKELHEEYHKNHHIDEVLIIDNNYLENNQIEIEPKKKIPRKTWTEKIIEELELDYPDEEWDWYNTKHKQFMLEYVLRKLGDTKKIFDEYQIKKFVFACFNSLDAKNFRTDISAKVMVLLG